MAIQVRGYSGSSCSNNGSNGRTANSSALKPIEAATDVAVKDDDERRAMKLERRNGSLSLCSSSSELLEDSSLSVSSPSSSSNLSLSSSPVSAPATKSSQYHSSSVFNHNHNHNYQQLSSQSSCEDHLKSLASKVSPKQITRSNNNDKQSQANSRTWRSSSTQQQQQQQQLGNNIELSLSNSNIPSSRRLRRRSIGRQSRIGSYSSSSSSSSGASYDGSQSSASNDSSRSNSSKLEAPPITIASQQEDQRPSAARKITATERSSPPINQRAARSSITTSSDRNTTRHLQSLHYGSLVSLSNSSQQQQQQQHQQLRCLQSNLSNNNNRSRHHHHHQRYSSLTSSSSSSVIERIDVRGQRLEQNYQRPQVKQTTRSSSVQQLTPFVVRLKSSPSAAAAATTTAASCSRVKAATAAALATTKQQLQSQPASSATTNSRLRQATLYARRHSHITPTKPKLTITTISTPTRPLRATLSASAATASRCPLITTSNSISISSSSSKSRSSSSRGIPTSTSTSTSTSTTTTTPTSLASSGGGGFNHASSFSLASSSSPSPRISSFRTNIISSSFSISRKFESPIASVGEKTSSSSFASSTFQRLRQTNQKRISSSTFSLASSSSSSLFWNQQQERLNAVKRVKNDDNDNDNLKNSSKQVARDQRNLGSRRRTPAPIAAGTTTALNNSNYRRQHLPISSKSNWRSNLQIISTSSTPASTAAEATAIAKKIPSMMTTTLASMNSVVVGAVGSGNSNSRYITTSSNQQQQLQQQLTAGGIGKKSGERSDGRSSSSSSSSSCDSCCSIGDASDSGNDENVQPSSPSMSPQSPVTGSNHLAARANISSNSADVAFAAPDSKNVGNENNNITDDSNANGQYMKQPIDREGEIRLIEGPNINNIEESPTVPSSSSIENNLLSATAATTITEPTIVTLAVDETAVETATTTTGDCCLSNSVVAIADTCCHHPPSLSIITGSESGCGILLPRDSSLNIVNNNNSINDITLAHEENISKRPLSDTESETDCDATGLKQDTEIEMTNVKIKIQRKLSIAPDVPIKSEPISLYYDLEARPFARGKFAQVKRCISKTSKQCFAAKCIKKRRRLVDIRHEIMLEIEALKLSYYTDHIVKLYEVFETPTEMILILEMANGGELQRVIDDEEAIDEKLVKRMIRQILEGLVQLHDNDIAHLDIKPQNLLLTEPFPEGSVKLCDFGISRRINKDCEIREICGTPDYVAPEILRYDPISLATDMWSLGVLTYVLLTGYSPFGSENRQQTFCNITQATLDFPSEIFYKISEDAVDFMQKLIVREPSERLTCQQARNHSWLCQSACPIN